MPAQRRAVVLPTQWAMLAPLRRNNRRIASKPRQPKPPRQHSRAVLSHLVLPRCRMSIRGTPARRQSLRNRQSHRNRQSRVPLDRVDHTSRIIRTMGRPRPRRIAVEDTHTRMIGTMATGNRRRGTSITIHAVASRMARLSRTAVPVPTVIHRCRRPGHKPKIVRRSRGEGIRRGLPGRAIPPVSSNHRVEHIILSPLNLSLRRSRRDRHRSLRQALLPVRRAASQTVRPMAPQARRLPVRPTATPGRVPPPLCRLGRPYRRQLAVISF